MNKGEHTEDERDVELAEQRALAFEAVGMGWWSLDLESGRVHWDERIKAMFGVEEGDQAYENILTLIHPDDRSMIDEAIKASTDPVDPKPYSVEYRLIRPDGSMRWLSSKGKAFFTGEGENRRIGCFAGTAVDITEVKLGQDALRESEGRFRFLSELGESTRDLVDPEDVMATASRMLGQHLGASYCAYADVCADAEHFRIHHDYSSEKTSLVGEYCLSDFGPRVAADQRAGRIFVMRDVDQELTPEEGRDAFNATGVKATVCCPLVKRGRLVAMMAVHQKERRLWKEAEILLVEAVVERCWAYIERARAARSLLQSEAEFRLLADAMPQIVFMAQPDGHVDYFNQRWYDYTGLPLGAVGYESWRSIHDEDVLERITRVWTDSLATGNPYEVEYRLKRADGAWRWHLGRALPMRDGQGNIVRWFGTNTDIHDKKLLEEENQKLLESEREARLEAERQGRIKDEFLATLSHELRTPLNAILGWSDVLQRGGTPEDMVRGMEVIRRNARTQAQIIEDLLDLSSIISGKVRLDVQRVDLVAVLDEAMQTVRPGAEAKGVRLFSVLDPRAIAVTGDPNRLQQIFWNLLNNAIKFTPRTGSVTVTLERVNSHLEVSVADTGDGINAEFLPLVFNRFQQADASTTRRYGGLGIGLAIVKQLVELHGGSVRAKSPGEGQGATFTVTLPVVIIHAFPEQAEERRHPTNGMGPEIRNNVSLQGVDILVVDDEPDARDLVKKLLEDCRATVRVAESAGRAMELIREGRPDVLVSDIGMPGEDGYALIRRLRKLSASEGGRIPALALTAYARSEDRTLAVQAGFQMHVAKPVEPHELLTMVASLAGR